jgi:hypothetical protein
MAQERLANLLLASMQLFCLQGGPCKEAIQVQAVKERKQNEKNLG